MCGNDLIKRQTCAHDLFNISTSKETNHLQASGWLLKMSKKNQSMKRSATLLVFTALVCAACANTPDQGLSDMEGSGDDLSSSGYSITTSPSGSGDGSGLVSTHPTRTPCVRPHNVQPPPSISEQDILDKVRCHLACLEKVRHVGSGSYSVYTTVEC